MLYKKIHRQYLREWKVGRKFKFDDENKVREVTEKPYIRLFSIGTDFLILISFGSGRIMCDGNIEWID